MSCRATRATRLSITARASAAEKTRFATLAHAAGISESRLALMAIRAFVDEDGRTQGPAAQDRKSTRLNSSHTVISYAVFCLKKKSKKITAIKSSARQTKRSDALARR